MTMSCGIYLLVKADEGKEKLFQMTLDVQHCLKERIGCELSLHDIQALQLEITTPISSYFCQLWLSRMRVGEQTTAGDLTQ
jgi:hypothetical protein